MTDDVIARGIAGLNKVPGRLEKVDNARGVTVLVDYAHSPDALEKTLQVVRQLTDKKLIAVFGCGGDRDRGKRPLMGEIAARLSDFAVLTSDNPRTEEPGAILVDVEAGVRKVGMTKLADIERCWPSQDRHGTTARLLRRSRSARGDPFGAVAGQRRRCRADRRQRA